MDLRRLKAIEEAKTWMGTPFIHQGAIKGARGGVGCGTLLIAAYGAAGVAVPTLSDVGLFPSDWHCNTTEERYLNILTAYDFKPVENPLPGDTAIFRTATSKVWSHSALVIEWPIVIHVMWRREVQYSDATRAPLYRREYAPMFLSPFRDSQ